MRLDGRSIAIALAAVGLATGSYALTGTTSVPASRTGSSAIARTIAQLTPSQCSAVGATSLVTGSGTVNGTTGRDLILGATGNDTLGGRGDNDCLVGGDGADTLDGGAGIDVCLGGPGVDVFLGCETQIQ